MAEIEITLPTVQYGNVKVRATPEELGLKSLAEAYDVGVASAVYLNLFSQGFKKGASLDVSAPQGAPEQSDGTDVHAEAQRLLEEGLGASEAEASDDAPWNSTVDKPKKPWENMDTAPAPVVDDVW